MTEIKDTNLIRDALGSPVPQYWDEASQMYIARTVDGSFVDVDFSKVKLLRDNRGTAVPQLWDAETARFVPSKGSGNGEVTIGSVTGLQSKLDQTTATLAETATFVTPEMFGAVGDGVTDDTSSLKDMFANAVLSRKNIEFGNKKQYILTASLTYVFESSLTIRGNGSTILPKHIETGEVRTTPKVIYCIEVKAPYVKVENLTIDGLNTVQDQFDTTDYGALKLVRGIWVEAEDIIINNVKGLNFYGDMFRFWSFKFVTIDGVYVENVGGKWHNSTAYDAFGDTFRFVHFEGTARVKMTNVEAYGKYKGNIYSRIAVVNQNSSGLIDEELTIEMENCVFKYYNRNFHIEENVGITTFNVRNSKFLCGVFAYDYNPSGDPKIFVNAKNIEIRYNNSPFNTVLGMYRTTFSVEDSKIYTNSNIDTIGSYSSRGKYKNCEFYDINKRQFNVSGAIVLDNCKLNFVSTMTDYLNYTSDVKIYNSVLRSTSTTADLLANASGSRIETHDCIFENYKPYARYRGAGNKMYLTAGGNPEIQVNQVAVYLGGKLVKSPSTCRIFPYHETFNDNNYFFARTSASSTDVLPIIPDGVTFPLNSRILMVAMAGDGSSHLIHNRDFTEGFYYAEIKVSGTGVVTVGNVYATTGISAFYTLTLDNVAKTLAKGGTYSNKIHQVFVPFYYKEQLPMNLPFS